MVLLEELGTAFWRGERERRWQQQLGYRGSSLTLFAEGERGDENDSLSKPPVFIANFVLLLLCMLLSLQKNTGYLVQGESGTTSELTLGRVTK